MTFQSCQQLIVVRRCHIHLSGQYRCIQEVDSFLLGTCGGVIHDLHKANQDPPSLLDVFFILQLFGDETPHYGGRESGEMHTTVPIGAKRLDWF